MIVRVVDGHLAAAFNRHIDRPRKRRPFLHEAIADQPELAVLGVDRRLVVDRTILEVKDQLSGHAITATGLEQLAVGEDNAVERAEGEEAAHEALCVCHGHDVSRQGQAASQGDSNSGRHPAARFAGRGCRHVVPASQGSCTGEAEPQV
jgi:hypothetical protein